MLSEIFLTGSREPWFRIRLSRRPKEERAVSTSFCASEGSDASPGTMAMRSEPYWVWRSERAEAVREVRTSLWEEGEVRRVWAILRPIPEKTLVLGGWGLIVCGQVSWVLCLRAGGSRCASMVGGDGRDNGSLVMSN